MPELKPDSYFEDRFWSMVDQSGACWLWTGARTALSYGIFTGRIDAQSFDKAHRYSYALANGSIPDGMHVLHRCDNRWCVNPEHLWLGTQADNVRDAHIKGRHVNGSRVGTSRFDEATIIKIRTANGDIADIAKQFGCDYTHVMRIQKSECWKHLPTREELLAAEDTQQ